MIKGTLRPNAVVVMELKADFLHGPGSINAVAAFIDTTTGKTHGSTTCNNWSPATLAALQQLKDAMENDLAQRHLLDPTIDVARGTSATSAEPQGLGEHISGGANRDADPA